MAGDPEIALTFLGGADEVGASSALVEAGGTTLLVDCGIRFEAGRALPDLAALSGRSVDAILLTHAHTDHSGALPVASEAWPATPIYMTPPTVDLVTILARDALRLMAFGFEREGEIPLYGEAAVENALHMTRAVPFQTSFAVGEVEITFLPASHILGASMVHLATPAGNVLFTGDYSVEAQRTVPALDRPSLPADLVITESTYGNRLHADRQAAEHRLVARAAEVLEGGGRVLIPAFAIGRAQEVLLILRQALERKELPDVPVFADGMVRAVCEVYGRHPLYVTNVLARRMRREHPFYTDRIRPVAAPAERAAVLEAGPCVIVASSGMLAGGASAFYAAALAPRERDAILITGYQDEESPGHALLHLAEAAGPRALRLGGREVEVHCSFETYSLSAHADRMQMAGLVEGLAPRTVVLVHGDPEARTSLERSLSCRDVVRVSTGSRVVRAFPGSRRPARRGPAEPVIDETRARSLYAGAPDGTLTVDGAALAWFGRPVPRIVAERLAQRLVELGVAARDDRRRGLLRVLGTTPEEGALEAELKAENPKGRLLEYCMRRGIAAAPFTVTELPGRRHRAEAVLESGGRTFTSGPHEASAPRMAEQLAARALLAALRAAEEGGEAEEITGEEAERLKRENPKGRLLERRMAERRPPPEFRVGPWPAGGFSGDATLAADAGPPLVSRRYRASAAKTVEQAVARDLLGQLDAGGTDAASPGEPGAAPAAPARADARMELNQACQQGRLEEFGYEDGEVQGPSHCPEFAVRAFAILPGGRRILSDAAVAPSRREARRLAAELLLVRLERRGP